MLVQADRMSGSGAHFLPGLNLSDRSGLQYWGWEGYRALPPVAQASADSFGTAYLFQSTTITFLGTSLLTAQLYPQSIMALPMAPGSNLTGPSAWRCMSPSVYSNDVAASAALTE